jgi:hypothetical protein
MSRHSESWCISSEVSLSIEEFDPNVIKFGRIVEHDPRSRDYGVAIQDGLKLSSIIWPRLGKMLNQGSIGACTGFAMAGWLQCAPHSKTADQAEEYDHDLAMLLYSKATYLDEFAGHYPPDDTGSSGNAVAKAARAIGEISGYRWAFSASGLLSALQRGPVIVGTVWTDVMTRPDRNGFAHVRGSILGGHEWLIRGCHLGGTDADRYLIADNSWGSGWGKRGSFFVSLTDWEVLRRQEADVTIPTS